MRNFPVLGTMLLLVLTGQTSMGNEDREIKIAADKVVYRAAANKILYQGNVSLQRGPLSFKANSLEVTADGGEITRVEARGTPIQLVYKRNDSENVTGKANRLVYRPTQRRVTMEGDVTLQQEVGSIQAHTIHYNLETQEATAGSAEDEERGVEVILSPQRLLPQ